MYKHEESTISTHRSAEAKPVLSRLNMWKSPHTAIDASYVPAWETNLGMIWTPVILPASG